MKQFVIISLPLVVPLAMYLIWWRWQVRQALAAGTPDDAPKFGDLPWLFIGLGAAGLITMAILATVLGGGADTSSTYVPPQMKDGQIVPGQHLPADGN